MWEHLKALSKNSDLAVAAGLLLVLSVMMIPIHPMVLDLLLAFTLSFSVVVLLISIYTKRPLDFSTFPTVLLIATLIRLSINVASTRNILLRGSTDGTEAAGDIIKSFGEFVVEGNYVVGIIVFTILVIINFMVITKGAGRIAEVAARFTLDAMPGKQMAIDADLNAGLIDELEAKQRRKDVAQEADFYGSMDGASKFVRGDAIAGIMITAVNIIGGIIVGVGQNEMSFTDAAEVFTLLTIGDGLVTQIPAFIISTAAGIIATRNTNEDALGVQVGKEFKVHPKAVYMASAVLFIFSAVPSLPKLPFMTIGFALGFLAYRMEKMREREETAFEEQKTMDRKTTSDNLEDLLPLELVELEVGYGLVSLVDSEQKGDLLERITHLRKQFALDWGVIIPSIRIKDNLELKPGGYSIKIKGVEVASGELLSDHFLAMDPGQVVEKIEGIEAKEPVFGLPAVWITEDQRDDALYNGYTVVDLSTIMATHITEVIKGNLSELMGREELVKILDNFKEINPKLVGDLIPDILSVGVVLKVMQNLLREGVSVRDLRSILESLAEHGEKIKGPEMLTELARQSLYRTITESIKGGQGDIPLFTLDSNLDQLLSEGIVQTEQGRQLSLDPKTTQNILASLNEKIEEATNVGEKMVLLCNPNIRGLFKKMTEKFIPNLVVVTHNELNPDINVRSMGTVRV